MDTMQARIEQLEQENAALRALLKKHGIAYPETAENQISAIANQGSRMLQNEVTPQMVSFFYTYFRGRKDVYSVRSRPKDGKAGYFPVCTHFWDHKLCPKTTGQKIACRDCPNRAYKPLNIRALLAHLKGEREDSSDVVGIYPLLPDDTCYFLVFDFDDHEGTFQGSEKTASWRDEVDALRKICGLEQIDALVERSRSGQGAHVWIFFSEPVSAQKARQFGTALLTKGAEVVSLKSFRAYDRMLPLQEHLPEGKLGNLIALPLQGRALRNGTSAFVDENWNAYPDQWGALKSARKLSVKEIEDKIAAWTPEAGLLGQLAEEPQEAEENTQKSFLPEKPWRKTELTLHPEDVEGAVDLVYANGVYIKSTNLKPRLQNQLRRLAAYKNPEFHKKLAMGFSTLGIPRIVYCGHDDGDFICLPRGCAEKLKELLEEAAISYHITDERQSDRKIKVSFAGQLYPEQQRAADALLAHDIGVLSAATAFGKTAVGAYLIAARQINTLVLVDNAEILKNWQEDLQKFLTIEEEPPAYTTPTGRVKRRKSVIGKLQGGQNTLTGILDVAMIPSLGKSERLKELVQGYGMVLMDECHHAGADTDTAVLRSVTAKYVYGLTATPKRDDGQDRKIFLQLGIRFIAINGHRSLCLSPFYKVCSPFRETARDGRIKSAGDRKRRPQRADSLGYDHLRPKRADAAGYDEVQGACKAAVSALAGECRPRFPAAGRKEQQRTRAGPGRAAGRVGNRHVDRGRHRQIYRRGLQSAAPRYAAARNADLMAWECRTVRGPSEPRLRRQTGCDHF